jgi:hypothetical protein
MATFSIVDLLGVIGLLFGVLSLAVVGKFVVAIASPLSGDHVRTGDASSYGFPAVAGLVVIVVIVGLAATFAYSLGAF